MPSARSIVPLRLELHPSLWLAGLLLFVHGGALVLLAFLPIPRWVTLLLVCAVAASFVATLTFHALLGGRRAVVQLLWNTEGDWTLITVAGKALEARLLPGSYVMPYLTVLKFKVEGRRLPRFVVLTGDALDVEGFRCLRVRLLCVGNSWAE